jgi:pyruvate kinase
MNLVWGVNTIRLDTLEETSDEMLAVIQGELLARGYVRSGENFVLVAGQSLSQEAARNFVKVERIE